MEDIRIQANPSVVASELMPLEMAYPTLKGWAIVNSPFGRFFLGQHSQRNKSSSNLAGRNSPRQTSGKFGGRACPLRGAPPMCELPTSLPCRRAVSVLNEPARRG